MALWFITVFNYQVNDYYESYFPGNDYEFLMAISTVELCGYVTGGLLFESFKVKPCTKLYLVSYSVCLLGAIGLVCNDPVEYPILDMILNALCKFGVAMAFQGVYLANELFPIVFSSTTFGICCLMGSTAAFSSIWTIYDFETIYPYYIFIGMCCAGIICTLLVKEY